MDKPHRCFPASVNWPVERMILISLDTLLFDLDGTLLPLNIEMFMDRYFQALVPKVESVVKRDVFIKQLWAATQQLVQNEDASRTNIEKFKHLFLTATQLNEEEIWPIFDAFYQQDFDNLRDTTRPSAISREICRIALDKGYQVVIATNPIFPAEAIYRRIEWAGLKDLPFTLVTTMENMHFCKPNPKYFLEILDRVGCAEDTCMMFGNDVQEDGVAGKLGIKTYLVTGCVIDRGLGHVEFAQEGSLHNVLEFVTDLPKR